MLQGLYLFHYGGMPIIKRPYINIFDNYFAIFDRFFVLFDSFLIHNLVFKSHASLGRVDARFIHPRMSGLYGGAYCFAISDSTCSSIANMAQGGRIA